MRNSRAPWRGVSLAILLALSALPSTAQDTWNQAYGNINNTSFINQSVAFGVAPKWTFRLLGPVEWSGPSLAPDGTIYVGTTDGIFQAVSRDGKGRCAWSMPGGKFASTPAVLPSGQVAILRHRQEGPWYQAELVLFTADCRPIWQVELPRLSRDYFSVASGAVKVWTSPNKGESFLFVHGRLTRMSDFSQTENDSVDELLVYSTMGDLVARRPTGRNCASHTDFDVHLSDLWDFLAGLWPSTGSIPPLYAQLGWQDSTPALLDATLRGISGPNDPLVAVTDFQCDPWVHTFQFHPSAASSDERLVPFWEQKVDSFGVLLSSPVLLSDGKLLYGTSSHRLRLLDIRTRTQVWQADTKEPVLQPPAVAPGLAYTLAEYKGWIFNPNGPTGAPVATARPQPMTQGGTLAAPAATLSQAIIPNLHGLDMWSPDLLNLVHTLRDENFLNTSPAISSAGSLYVIGQTGDRSTLYAFGN